MSTRKKILFVDDEPNILAGLKRMLRSMRSEMEFFFAENSDQALQCLTGQAIDIVVADMRMAGMDGASLLAVVQKQFPQAVRIMLTGHADDEAVLRTVDVAHRFLTKPIDSATLKETLQGSGVLQDMLNNSGLKSLVAGLGTLPTLPETYANLEKRLRQPDCALADIARIIEQDPAMTAKILQLVNSAFFGLYTRVESPFRAVNLLGLDTIKALVLGLGIFSELPVKSSRLFSVSGLWSHSMTCATFAKAIAGRESEDTTLIEQAFIGGLLHDVGKLLLFAKKRPEYEQAIDQALKDGRPIQETERDLFGASHCDVGAYLLGLWGLPGPVVEALLFHHRIADYPEPGLSPALIVHVADSMYHKLQPDHNTRKAPMAMTVLQQANLADRLESWTELCADILARGEDDD
jgi:HD-like signal output (HDOD) protein